MSHLIEINNKHYIDAKVVMLATKHKNYKIGLNTFDNTLFNNEEFSSNHTVGQHLYITSNEEIKEGDWCVHNYGDGGIEQSKYDLKEGEDSLFEDYRKIIATTDSSLCPNTGDWNKLETLSDIYYPQPSKEFIQSYIESYNKGKVIEDVLVEVETYHDFSFGELTQEYESLKLKDNTIIIKEKEESWEDILNSFEQTIYDKENKYSNFIEYLKNHYNPPTKK